MLIIKTPEGLKQVVAPGIDIYEYAAANGGTVMDDSEFVEPPKTCDQLTAETVAEAASLRAVADYEITPLKYAADIGEATDAEAALLIAWKKYIVALNRVPDQPGYPTTVNWPTVPA
jgi:hypothetical protein